MEEKKKNIPKRRFKEFQNADAWEQRELGEIKDVRDGTHDSPKYQNTGFPLVTSKNLKEYGLDLSEINYISKEDYIKINKRSKVNVDDILFGMIGTIGNPVLLKESNFAIKNVALIKENKLVLNNFLIHLLRSPLFNSYLVKENAGGTQKFISLSKIREFVLLIPDTNEQFKIGSFFGELDQTITLHQRKLDKYKAIKESYLQEMFPAEGQRKPKRRFPGFTEDWEQRELKDVINKLSGGASITPKDYRLEGIRTIPKSAVNDTGIANLYGSKFVTQTFFNFKKKSKVCSGELVTSLRDLVSTAPTMGRIVEIQEPNEVFLMPQGVYRLDINDNIVRNFLIAFSNSNVYRKIIQQEKSGSTQVHIRNEEFLKVCIYLPSFFEQENIGNLIFTLDQTITLHQKKLDKLKKLKKALLEEMFV